MSPKLLLARMSGVLVLAGSVAFAQLPDAVQPVGPAPPADATSRLQATHTLDAADVNTWLDGFMPLALANGNIAGAVVVVVKDGRVLTQRGFGVSDVATQAPVDPERTLFRAGSTSKLFTWTAVMQQVEAGKLDLDADVDTYLDFRMPAAFGRPITLRQLMTHTAGFEEHAKHLFVARPADLMSIGDYLKTWIPRRIFPPGTVPAYSNYGATLAGYIVQRVSGEEFDAYIDHHIFQPLGIKHGTFDQPVPAAWIADLSKSYTDASGPAHPFELIPAAPAGSLSITGADMARLMIAHLNDGQLGDARILKPETAELMHAQAFAATPPLPGMALGFYHEDRNGHVIIGHAGDTDTFHTDLHLFLKDGSGLFVCFNSLGVDGAAHTQRTLLFHQFADRYYPAPAGEPPTLASARADAAIVAGTYVSSRRSDTSFLHLAYMMGAAKVAADADGVITLSELKQPGGALERWRETGRFVWQKIGGVDRLAAVVKDGKVQALGMEGAPFEVFQPASGAYAGWNLVVLEVSLAVLAITAVLWPVGAVVRWRYGRGFALTGPSATLHRLVRVTATVDVVLAAGWLVVISLLGKDITLLNDPLDPWLRALQILGIIGILGGVVGVLNMVQVWLGHGTVWWAKLTSVALASATVGAAWIIIGQRLVTASLQF